MAPIAVEALKKATRVLFLLLLTCLPSYGCIMPAMENELKNQLIAEINQERALSGLHPFVESTLLERAAYLHACENAAHNRLSHSGLDGSSLGERVSRVGYNFRHVTENVAVGYEIPSAVLKAWLLSPSHRQNIFDPRSVDLGIAITIGQDGRMHWVMNGGIR